MTRSEQIADTLGVLSTDVVIENDNFARLKDRELTEQEQELIAHVFESEQDKKIRKIREEVSAMVDGIANAIESGKQGKDLADEIRNMKKK